MCHRHEEPGKFRTILKSLQYADKKDKILLLLGILSAFSVGFVHPYNVFFLFTPVVSTIIKAETPGNPYNVTMSEEIPKFIKVGHSYFINGSITFICGIIQIMASELASRNIIAKIKTAFLSKMLFLDMNGHDRLQEKFTSTVSQDMQKMMVLFDSKMTNVAEITSFFFFGCLAGFIVSWKIAVLNFVLMFVNIIVVYIILQKSKKKGELRQEYEKKCTKITSEVLSDIRSVVAYGGEYYETGRYKNELKKANQCGLKHSILISIGKGFNYFQLCICYLVAYYLSVRLYLIHKFNDPGYIVVILIAQINAMYHCAYMLSTIYDVYLAKHSAFRIMRFLNSETSYSNSVKQGIKLSTFKPEVSFRNVSFSYPSNLHAKVLHDLTLDIEPGKVTAVVGASGAGKSTIVSLITRLYDVTSGEILIGGVDIKKLNVNWLRNQIAVVTQEPTLFDTSIEENIRYGNTAVTMNEIIDAAKISHAQGFIEKLPGGYSYIVGERGVKLSGGQKQRIAIARAIVKKPMLLLLDEATSALDYYSEGIVQGALDDAMKGRTTLIIAHRMSAVRKADVIYAIKDGHVMEKGTHTELMDLKGHYYTLAKNQEQVEKDRLYVMNQENVPKEKSIVESKLLMDDTLEALKSKKTLGINIQNFKVVIVWLVAIVFTTIASTFLPTFYYIFSLFCESFTYNKDELYWIALFNAGCLFGLGFIMFFSVIFSDVMSAMGTQIWMGFLQKKAFNNIISMDICWFDKNGNSPNECFEILTKNPPLIKSVTGERAAQVVIFILSFLFSLSYSFFVCSSVTLANAPIILTFIIINYLRMRPSDSDARSASLATTSAKVAAEYVKNVKIVQILSCQNYIIDQYHNMLKHSKKEAILGIVWFAAVYGFSKTLIQWSMGVLFAYGANAIGSGEVKGTSLIGVVSSLSLASMLAGPALILTSQYSAATQALKQLKRIANSKTSLNTPSDQRAKPEIKGNIVFQDVEFHYPTREKVEVLKKLNLNIEARMTVALIGESGSGKSTIFSLLERFYIHNKGKILIDGIDINDINVRYLRSQMALVPQEPVLFDTTIKKNILYGSEDEVTMDKIINAAKIANVHNFIMKLPQAYNTVVGECGSKLSGGQKQRIAIARAVLRNPKILLLDEATSSLDTENEKAVHEALEKASTDRTCIVIAHRFSTICKADKIIVLKCGVAVEEGNHVQLMEKKGHYYSLINKLQ